MSFRNSNANDPNLGAFPSFPDEKAWEGWRVLSDPRQILRGTKLALKLPSEVIYFTVTWLESNLSKGKITLIDYSEIEYATTRSLDGNYEGVNEFNFIYRSIIFGKERVMLLTYSFSEVRIFIETSNKQYNEFNPNS